MLRDIKIYVYNHNEIISVIYKAQIVMALLIKYRINAFL